MTPAQRLALNWKLSPSEEQDLANDFISGRYFGIVKLFDAYSYEDYIRAADDICAIHNFNYLQILSELGKLTPEYMHFCKDHPELLL